MKRHPFLLIATGALAAGLLLSAGCSDGKPRRLSENETLEIKNLEADARFAASLRDFARAEKDHAAAAAINPDDPSLQLLLGMAQARQGKKDDARKAYKKAVKLAEAQWKAAKQPASLIERASALALLGDVEAALKAIEKAVELGGGEKQLSALAARRRAFFASPEFRQVALLEK